MRRVLTLLALALAGCVQSAPPLTAQVLAFTCDSDDRYTEAALTIRNTADRPIEYAKVYIRLGDTIEDRYVRPLALPPQAMGTASIGRRGRHGCQLLSVQDESGRTVVLSN